MTKILVADDHPLVVSGIHALLRGTEFQVVATVSDGAAALEALPIARPEILLLDVDMPHRSGLDVLRILRNRGDTTPVVLLTAELDSLSAVEGIQLAVNGIVLKETAPETLLSCLRMVRGGGRWIDPDVTQAALESAFDARPGAKGPLASLSSKERAVVGLVAKGMRNREIATGLGITEGTVKVHLHKIYEKLAVSNRTELALLATAN